MVDWPRVAVKSLCSLIVDCVNRTAPVIERETPFRMIRTTNVKEGRIDLSTCRYVDEPTYERWTRRAKLLDGDVILTREAPIGEVGYVQKLGPVFLGQRLMQFRPDPKKVVPRYLYYAFRSPDLQHQFGTHNGSGSVVSHIRVADCHEFKVSVPPIDHQQNVVTLVGSLDDKIELNRRMNETLEAMAQAIFRDWFVDFGPTRRKLEGATDPLTIMGGLVQDTERAQVLAALFPATMGNDGLPEGWRLGVTSALVEFNPKEPLKKGTPAPYSDMSSLPTSGPLADPPVERVYGSGMRFRNGDALLARITPCLENGKSAFVDFLPDAQTVGWGSTEFYVLRSRKGLPAPFSYLLVRHPEFRAAAIASMTGTSGRQRAQVDRLEDFPFAEVPKELHREFGKFILPMFDKMTANGGENRTLAATRDLLLPKLMSGEIRLSEAEDLMEAAQ